MQKKSIKKKPIAKRPTLGQRRQSAKRPKATTPTLLTMGEYPPGFSNDGRRLIAKCPEFRLYELYRVGGRTELETIPKIERALWRALFRIKGSPEGPYGKGAMRRLHWAVALKKLMQFKARGYTGSEVPLANALARAFAPLIEEVTSSGSEESIKEGADKLSKMFRDAVLAIARERGAIKDDRSKLRVPAEAVLIWEAQGNFMHTRKRPRKNYLRKRLEAIGFEPPKRNAAADWRLRFERACLDKLPE